ncbi:hypothetical protein [Paenibacillus hunanensis]|uniref:Uncharacterized protein n=1 Tax=Paenibacillus hunanensis TaxID=539262 RepID=A0ABU1IU67_9BACL|nr:hypothetical protein [Paenibacillus hunanensis]MDR6242555.1 hypothetical protein [Paenibacillus hunanensis]GGJ00953.1 hypothetical protein GCM10008022_07320 [Paenibacillus hunanensis]
METKLGRNNLSGEERESEANKLQGMEEENKFLRKNLEILFRENEAIEKFRDQEILLHLLQYIKDNGGVTEASAQQELKMLRRKLEIAHNRVEVAFNRMDTIHAQLEESRNENRKLHNEIENYQRIILEKEATIMSLLNSSSWKITSPLRAVFNKLRGK